MTAWKPGSSCRRCRRRRSPRVSRPPATSSAPKAGSHASVAARCVAGRRCGCLASGHRSVRRRVERIRRQTQQWW